MANQSMSRGAGSIGGHVTPTFGHGSSGGGGGYAPGGIGPPLSPNRGMQIPGGNNPPTMSRAPFAMRHDRRGMMGLG